MMGSVIVLMAILTTVGRVKVTMLNSYDTNNFEERSVKVTYNST